ncbi:hypothetical protein [Pseudorhodobacter sp. E13]|uniref:hypothetical protein n=1 Tax=Pseudorhodobacter sp. E13 TaxID=2487931 RepID=UPI000F8F03A3|nr:hypothetical protein [Pseudorhodobacter sp. E13]
MANETKNWVLVSAHIPSKFDVLDFDRGQGLTNPIRSDWEHRVYEVAEFGSFEGVEITEDDRFIAQVCGASLEEIDEWPHETGMIGDIRSWADEYHLVAINGDYVTLPVEDRHFRAYVPQQFGLEPFPVWDPALDVKDDLTAQVFGK